MTITIYYQNDPVAPVIVQYVEFVRLVALDSIETKTWGNGSVIHRKIKSFKIEYDVPSN